MLLKFILFILISINCFTISIEDDELKHIGELIFKNETNGKKINLTAWNKGEEFPSFGIGHFIWYPKKFNGPFDESFPKLMKFFIQNGVEIPKYLEGDAPWNSRKEFYNNLNNTQLSDLRELLDREKPLQVKFIFNRVQNSLKLIELNSTEQEFEIIKDNFNLLKRYKTGLYPLIDYVNFKGEGIQIGERYKGQGWGLKQVLLNMDRFKSNNPIESFSLSAKYILDRRIANSDPKRGEKRWKIGWHKRIDTYLKEYNNVKEKNNDN